MKHNQLDKFIHELESIKMTTFEKNILREKLVAFTSDYTPVTSPYYSMMSMAKRSFALAFVAIFSIVSFSNAASKNSLPGDIFYPVKIAHEEIALATTFGTSKKITYEIRRTEKRIQEATRLIQNDNVETPAEQVIAVDNIKKQTTKVKQHIEDVKKDNPEEALILNSELKSTVKINQAALRNLDTSPKELARMMVSEQPVSVTLSVEPVSDTMVQDVAPSALIEDSIPTPIEEEVGPQTSFVDSLLQSLDEEVKSIEAFEDNVAREILEQDNLSDYEVKDNRVDSDETSPDTQSEDLSLEVISEENEVASIELINTEIKSLEKIIAIKKSIKEIKVDAEMHIHTTIDDEGNQVIFDETIIRKEVDSLIANKKYNQAFLKLQEILEHFQNEKITKSVTESIKSNAPSLNEVIPPDSSTASELNLN